MITLLHNAALLSVSVDTGRLFDGDECYQLAIELALNDVADTRLDIARRQAAELEDEG